MGLILLINRAPNFGRFLNKFKFWCFLLPEMLPCKILPYLAVLYSFTLISFLFIFWIFASAYFSWLFFIELLSQNFFRFRFGITFFELLVPFCFTFPFDFHWFSQGGAAPFFHPLMPQHGFEFQALQAASQHIPLASLTAAHPFLAAGLPAALLQQQQQQQHHLHHHHQMQPALAAAMASPLVAASATTPCTTLFVANLGPSVSEQELKDIFGSFPGFTRLRMHNKGGAPVAFVEYQVKLFVFLVLLVVFQFHSDVFPVLRCYILFLSIFKQSLI